MPLFTGNKVKKTQKLDNSKLEHQMDLAKHGPGDVIDFSQCQLGEIPDGTYALCRVLLKELLILHSNQLVTLKEGGSYESLAKLRCLRILDVHNNGLIELPQSIGSLQNLQILNMMNNSLRSLPDSIGSLTNLIELNVKNNRLSRLPDTIADLHRLRMLDISSNNIKTLPKQMHRNCALENLILDAAEMTFPSSGTAFILQFLCDEEGVVYRPATSFALDLLKPPTLSITKSNSADELDSIALSLASCEKLRDEKRKQQLKAIQELLANQEQQAQLIAQANSNRKDLLQKITEEQTAIDSQLLSIQQRKDLEKEKLLEALQYSEEHTQNLLTELLMLNERARLTEDLFEADEKRRINEDYALRLKAEEYLLLRKQDIQRAMEDTLAKAYGMEKLLQMHTATQREIAGRVFEEDRLQSEHVHASLCAKDRESQQLLNTILQSEYFQMQAVEALLFQRDIRTNRINAEIELIQNELVQLSQLERKRRDLQVSFNHLQLEQQRMDLAKVLEQLIKERQRRSEELKHILKQMEREKTRGEANFWLLQYQRLLDWKPQTIIDAEAMLDPDVSKLLYQCEAELYIPVFATHGLTTMIKLCMLTDQDLTKIGVYQLGIRKALLDAIQHWQSTSACRSKSICALSPSAPTASFLSSKKTDAKDDSKSPSADAASTSVGSGGRTLLSRRPSAPPLSALTERPDADVSAMPSLDVAEEAKPDDDAAPLHAHVERDCVVCMAVRCSMLFLPCGHVCCCVTCAQRIHLCPLCRNAVEHRIDISEAVSNTNTSNS